MILFLSIFLFAQSASSAPISRPGPLIEREWIRLESYKPFYFVVGVPDGQGQISLKAQAAKGLDLYLAYSQLVFWELFDKSAPIREVNYNPEIFYRIGLREDAQFLDIGIYEHESNGKDGDISRSWDRSYLRFTRNLPWSKDRAFSWSFKAFLPYRLDEKNKDITRYRGLWEGQFVLSQNLDLLFDINEVIFRFYPGGSSRLNPLEGGRELIFRGKVSVKNLSIPLIFQIFQGRGESLLDYKQRRFGLRAGFGF